MINPFIGGLTKKILSMRISTNWSFYRVFGWKSLQTLKININWSSKIHYCI